MTECVQLKSIPEKLSPVNYDPKDQACIYRPTGSRLTQGVASLRVSLAVIFLIIKIGIITLKKISKIHDRDETLNPAGRIKTFESTVTSLTK